ncbi:substrate-binding domain-containing protein [Xenococcus sp. PCC 7305]|uniref:substrate-binding domain-containing protein n=1 Tax=Xenococcus sp. PCC 7305 TaxID=102125 RepID=UPI00130DCBE2|nr:substrate-binding domain-containing protein [Xenococcus sp. PCC 7305]
MSLISLPVQAQSVTVPEITTKPIVLGQKTLQWPREGGMDEIPERPFDYPDLTGQANILEDWHMQTSSDDWDLLFSTSGNFYRFLNVFFRQTYLPNNPVVEQGQWGYSTSPPVSLPQLKNGGRLSIGNMEILGMPMVVMGPKSIMNGVVKGGYNDGEPAKILSNFGNVLLVPSGNPQKINNIWDLGRENIRVATSNPETEAGSFDNYSSSVFHMAFREVEADTGDINIANRKATNLFNQIFNPKNNERRRKWVVGDRIHHRDVPQALADGEADVGLMFYHLAQTAVNAHPGLFEIVPLGGTVENPEPLLGNRVATMQAIRIAGNWTPQQTVNRDNFFSAITDPVANSALLTQYWVREPVTTGNNQPPLP